MNCSTLVIAVRGWSTTGDWLLFGQPGGDLTPEFAAALEQRIAHAEVWCPELEMNLFSMWSPEELAQDLFAQINRRMAVSPRIRSVVLLGFSAGSLLARRVFCLAHGASPDGSLSGTPAPWVGLIDRMVILSGITRGWEFSSASPAHVRFVAPVLLGLTSLVGRLKHGFLRRPRDPAGNRVRRAPFIWQVMRGAPFVISTRLQYVNVLRRLRTARPSGSPMGEDAARARLRSEGIPSTVFLLGAKDEFVSPADCTELGPRAEFVYIELPGSNHVQAIQISADTPPARVRPERVVAAVADPFEELGRREWAVRAEDIDDYLDPMDISGNHGVEAPARDPVEQA